MIKNREEWVAAVRDVSLLPGSPVQQKDGKWTVAERLETWEATGPRIFDAHLDRFRKVAVEVLRECDPKFELEQDQRFAASIHGKVLKFSHTLRNGLAETLALLGSCPKTLTSCSHGMAETTALLAVRETLQDADWILWASLGNQLTLLAEASPDEFLDQVEAALNRDPCPFRELFAQEGSGIAGWNYMTGLLWALEELAWHPDYLTRVIVILGELAGMDPGGNWANRPANSLATILLPWHYQTCAPLSKRQSAIQTLLREQPSVGWKLLLGLLPHTHGFTMGSHKPKWRKFIPDDWPEKITLKEYWEQVAAYAEMAVDAAGTDLSRWAQLIDQLANLPNAARERVLQHLSSTAVVSLPEAERLPIWESLVDLVGKHRKYSDAEWAMPAELVTKLEEVSTKLAPRSATLVHHRLFSNRDFDLYDEKGNWDEQAQKLMTERKDALREILNAGDVPAVLEFAHQVTRPETVGLALGQMESPTADAILLPDYLSNDEKAIASVVANFVWGRYWTKGLSWADSQLGGNWTLQQKVKFLTLLPFMPEVWRRADELLANESVQYWKNARVNPWGLKDDVAEAAEKLVQHGRPWSAISCLCVLIHGKIGFPHELAIRALMTGAKDGEGSLQPDRHDLVEVIKWLQATKDVDPNALFQVEWAYLRLLDRHFDGVPQTLERRLASDPSFFCDVIGFIFRSDKEERTDRQPSDQEKKIAENAYHLLHNWQIVPGTAADDSFDPAVFTKWLDEVKQRTNASGHFSVAMSRIGNVLVYAKPDPTGLWIHKAVAEALNAKDADRMRSGFTCELFNRRGVHSFTDGKEGKEIAAVFHAQANALEEAGYHRIATALRELAKSYERTAEREALRDPFED